MVYVSRLNGAYPGRHPAYYPGTNVDQETIDNAYVANPPQEAAQCAGAVGERRKIKLIHPVLVFKRAVNKPEPVCDLVRQMREATVQQPDTVGDGVGCASPQEAAVHRI